MIAGGYVIVEEFITTSNLRFIKFSIGKHTYNLTTDSESNALFKKDEEPTLVTTTLQLFWKVPIIRMLTIRGCYTHEFIKLVSGNGYVIEQKILMFDVKHLLTGTDYKIYINSLKGVSKLLNVSESLLRNTNIILYDGKKAPPYAYISFYDSWEDVQPKLIRPIHDDFLANFNLNGYEDELVIIPTYSEMLDNDSAVNITKVMFRGV